MTDTSIGNLIGAGVLLGVTKKVVPKKPYKQPSVRELTENMKKMRQRGLKPHLKGYRGGVKLEFE